MANLASNPRSANIYIGREFPSPCGVNIVANVEDLADAEELAEAADVSVPLRGKYRGE